MSQPSSMPPSRRCRRREHADVDEVAGGEQDYLREWLVEERRGGGCGGGDGWW